MTKLVNKSVVGYNLYMKIRNYLMYWANRLMDPTFKNEYYLANLKKFWDHTYPDLCLSSILCCVTSILLFPWGINFSESHPLYNAGWGFAVGQFLLSNVLTFTLALILQRLLQDKDTDKLENSVWMFFTAIGGSLMLQHVFTHFLYRTVPWAMVASLTPLLSIFAAALVIIHLPGWAVDKINDAKNKFVKGVIFIFVDSRKDASRLTLLLEKMLGTQPREHSPVKDLQDPKPKDYKIWGVKSNAEKELQKILDE